MSLPASEEIFILELRWSILCTLKGNMYFGTSMKYPCHPHRQYVCWIFKEVSLLPSVTIFMMDNHKWIISKKKYNKRLRNSLQRDNLFMRRDATCGTRFSIICATYVPSLEDIINELFWGKNSLIQRRFVVVPFSKILFNKICQKYLIRSNSIQWRFKLNEY